MSSDLKELISLTVKINERAIKKKKCLLKEMPHIKFFQCPSFTMGEKSSKGIFIIDKTANM